MDPKQQLTEAINKAKLPITVKKITEISKNTIEVIFLHKSKAEFRMHLLNDFTKLLPTIIKNLTDSSNGLPAETEEEEENKSK